MAWTETKTGPWLGFLPPQDRYLERLPSPLMAWLLSRVPRWFRSRRPLRRYYWQPAEIEAARREGAELAKFLWRMDQGRDR